MTREDFDRLFAATANTTDGFNADDLTEINDAIYALVSDLDLESEDLDQDVGHASGDVFNAWVDGATADTLISSVRASRAAALDAQKRAYPHLFS